MAKSKYPHLTKRPGSVFWQIDVNNKVYGKVRESTEEIDEHKAHLICQARLSEIALKRLDGTSEEVKNPKPMAGGMTLKEGFDKCMNEHWKVDRKPSYILTLNQNWNVVTQHLPGDTPLSAITRSRLIQFRDDLFTAGDSKATVNRKLSMISVILNKAAQEWEVLEALPKFPTVQEDEGTRLPMREGEYLETLTFLSKGEGIHDLDMRDFMIVAWGTGARRGELLALADRDVDLKANTISFMVTKTRKPRVIEMTPEVAKVMKGRLGSKERKPFGTLNARSLNYELRRIRKACGLDDRVCIHSIRHSVVSSLLDADVALHKVQAYVGHTRIETTKRYTHLSASASKDCTNVLSKRGK